MKRFAGTFRWAQTSYFWRVLSETTLCKDLLYSIKATAKWRNSVYVLTEIFHQRSKWLGPNYEGINNISLQIFSFELTYQSLNRALPSRKCSVKAPSKFPSSISIFSSYQRMLPFGGNGNQVTPPFSNFSVSPDHNRLSYELNSEDCNDRQFEIFFRGKKFLKSFKW